MQPTFKLFFALILSFPINSLLKAEDGKERAKFIHMTLEESKNYALTHNRGIKSLRHSLEEAKAKAWRATSAFFPMFGVVGGANTQLSNATNITSQIAYLHGSYNIFNGYKDSNQREIQDISTKNVELELKQKEFWLQLEVEKYFNTFINISITRILNKKSIELNAKLASVAQRRRQAGLGSDADIMEFSLRESSLKANLLILDQKIEEVRIDLRNHLGYELDEKIEPTGNLQHQHVVGVFQNYVNKLEQANPSLEISRNTSTIANIESKNWQSKWLPQINFEAKSGYLELDAKPDGEKGLSTAFLLTAKMDLFSGYETRWEKQESLARKMKAEEELQIKKISLSSEIERHFVRLKAIEKTVDLEEKNEVLAEKYYETVLKEYNSGIRNSTDLKMAADLFSEVSLRRVQYKYEFLSSRIELEKALGFSVEVENIQDKDSHPQKSKS